MSTWHAPAELLARYATAPEALDNVTASSIEAHIIDCESCRRTLAAAVGPATTVASWNAIADEIDRPRASIVERVLAGFFPDAMARVVAATPALQLSWLAVVAGVIAAVVAVSRSTGDLTPFLAFAPLVPLAGVAMSFGSTPDPAGEAAVATPLHGSGLVVRRTIVVLASSLVVLLPGSAALPGLEWRSVGWILPSIGLSLVALALSTWFAPLTAMVTAAVAWEVAVVTTGLVDQIPRDIAAGPLFGPVGQVAFAVMIPLAWFTLGARQLRLSTMEAR